MEYRVQVSVSIFPADDKFAHNTLFFSRKFMLRGERYSDIARQVDFIYDKIDPEVTPSELVDYS